MRWLLLSLYLFLLVGGSTTTTDWTHNCPSGCKCGWVNGRKTVECRDAGFTEIPVGLSDEVQVLDLRGNIIKSLRPYVFRDAGLMNINRIKMNHCGIQRIDRLAFANLMILIELDLSDNGITELTMESFETNARLRELHLTGNPLNLLLGASFPPLLHFQTLSLRNCNLSSIPSKAFEQLTTVEIVDLSGNQFQTLSVELFEHLPKLKSLALHDNPWKCDCHLQKFRDWTLGHNLLTVQPTKCAQPDRLANLEWNQLLTSSFTCSPQIAALQVSGQATDAYIVGDLGKTIRLECLVTGNPPAEVRWVKDTIAMTNITASATGKSYYVQVSGDTERWVNLTLTHTQVGDAGEYTCVGENNGGSAERNITLNFQDVPSGAGVGMGMMTEAGGGPGRSWIWILIGCLVGLVVLFILIGSIVCICSKRRPRKDLRTEMKGVPLEERMSPGEDAFDGGSKIENQSTMPLLSPSTTSSLRLKSEDPDYPDLLDLPRGVKVQPGSESPVGSIRSRSTLPDTTLLWSNKFQQPIYNHPQELNPAALYGYDPAQNYAIYAQPYFTTPYGRAQSPYSGSVVSLGGSEPPKAIIPPSYRRGYVTMPRRPRVPSWSPGTPLSPSSIGSDYPSPLVKYDNLGQRTTADGSLQNLNKLDANTPVTPQNYTTLPYRGRIHSGRSNGSATSTPTSYHPPAPPYFSFDPIQENEVDSYGLPSPDEEPTPTAKKVPPKAPPKPKKLGGTGSPVPTETSVDFLDGTDGTEV